MIPMRYAPALALVLAACSSGEDEPAAPTPSPSASAEASSAPGRAFRYTRLDDCKVLESTSEEGGYYLAECPGEGGYKLRVSESDLRQSVTVIAPDGAGTDLDLARHTGGGFSSLGETAEWRGAGEGAAFVPDSLIVRHEVVTNPEGTATTSYLVIARLTPTPCVTARLEPGPEQNARARNLADAGAPCISG